MKTDPTRTTTLRRSFAREMLKRLRSIKRAIVELVVELDVFALTTPGVVKSSGVAALVAHRGSQEATSSALETLAEPQAWRFLTSEDKAKQFNAWLRAEVHGRILGEEWTKKYIDQAYKKGASRSFSETAPRSRSDDFFAGTKDSHLKRLLRDPEKAARARLLASRTFEGLEGITDDMALKMNRILANGFIRGNSPKTMAREMVQEIEGMTKVRALRLVRTEIISAHAEGQLDSLEEMGIDDVTVLAEWKTASDPCPLCQKLSGAVMTVEEARGLIPRHPNCQCSWIPSEQDEVRGRRKAYLKKINASLREEGGRRKSTWAGKDV